MGRKTPDQRSRRRVNETLNLRDANGNPTMTSTPIDLDLRYPKRRHHVQAQTQRQPQQGGPEYRRTWTSAHLPVMRTPQCS